MNYVSLPALTGITFPVGSFQTTAYSVFDNITAPNLTSLTILG